MDRVLEWWGRAHKKRKRGITFPSQYRSVETPSDDDETPSDDERRRTVCDDPPIGIAGWSIYILVLLSVFKMAAKIAASMTGAPSSRLAITRPSSLMFQNANPRSAGPAEVCVRRGLQGGSVQGFGTRGVLKGTGVKVLLCIWDKLNI